VRSLDHKSSAVTTTPPSNPIPDEYETENRALWYRLIIIIIKGHGPVVNNDVYLRAGEISYFIPGISRYQMNTKRRIKRCGTQRVRRMSDLFCGCHPQYATSSGPRARTDGMTNSLAVDSRRRYCVSVCLTERQLITLIPAAAVRWC